MSPSRTSAAACREYAEKFVGIQREEFERLGVLGEWDDPYLTMAPRYQATIVRALGDFVEQGLVYKGKKSVHWCIPCRTALAEAEVEYDDRTSRPSIDVRVPARATPSLAERSRARSRRSPDGRCRCSSGPRRPGRFPSNLALAFHPDVEYGALRRRTAAAVIVAKDLAERVGARRRRGRPFDALAGARFQGRRLERLRVPASARRPRLARPCSATTSRSTAGTGVVHTAPGHGADDYHTGVQVRARHLRAGRRGGSLHRRGRALRRAAGVRRQPERSRPRSPRARPPLAPRGHPALVPALLALQEPGHLPGDRAVVHRHGREDAAAEGARGDRGHVAWVPAWGEERIDNMIATRPDWCISRQRPVGRADPGLRLHGVRRGRAARRSSSSTWPPSSTTDGADAWYDARGEELAARGLRLPEVRRHAVRARRRTSSTSGSTRAPSRRGARPSAKTCRWPADVYLEGSDQHRGWFHSLAAHRRRHAGPGALSTRSSPTASPWTATGARCRRASATTSSHRTLIKHRAAPRSCGCGPSWSTTARTCASRQEILTRVAEAYRKIRNTLRVPALQPLRLRPGRRHRRRRANARGARPLRAGDRHRQVVARRIARGLRDYEFRLVFHQLVSTRRSTCRPSTSTSRRTGSTRFGAGRRRAARRQTACSPDRRRACARLLAPVLPFTTDEAWRGAAGSARGVGAPGALPRQARGQLDEALVDRWARSSTCGARQRERRRSRRSGRSKTIAGESLGGRRAARQRRAPASSCEHYEAALPTLFGVVSAVRLARSGDGQRDA